MHLAVVGPNVSSHEVITRRQEAITALNKPETFLNPLFQILFMVDDIDSTEEFNEALKNDAVVVDLWASWCMPCLMMAPVFEEISGRKEMKKVKFINVNVDEHPEIAEKFNIMSIPTTIILKKGKEAGRIIGATGAESFEEKIKKFL